MTPYVVNVSTESSPSQEYHGNLSQPIDKVRNKTNDHIGLTIIVTNRGGQYEINVYFSFFSQSEYGQDLNYAALHFSRGTDKKGKNKVQIGESVYSQVK